jgi:hypothetical protein
MSVKLTIIAFEIAAIRYTHCINQLYCLKNQEKDSARCLNLYTGIHIRSDHGSVTVLGV